MEPAFYKLCLVIPCFNEYDRLPERQFRLFLETSTDVLVLFVNDGSTDGTLGKLQALSNDYPEKVMVLDNKKNLGKAGSIRNGILFLTENVQTQFMGYLDADLATSLEECLSLTEHLKDGKQFVFASRILRIGAVVERKFSRFLTGRIIATIISKMLGIPVYDTQCGSKVFCSTLAPLLFKEPFISKWLFDVELFSRILCAYGTAQGTLKMLEIPVERWVDKGDSKVKMSYFFKLWHDLYLIWKTHKKNRLCPPLQK